MNEEVSDDGFDTWPCDTLMRDVVDAQDYVYRHHRTHVVLTLAVVQKLVTEIERLNENGADDPVSIAVGMNGPYETDFHEMAYTRAVNAIIRRRIRYVQSGRRTWQTKREHERRGRDAPFAPPNEEQDD